MNTASAAEFLYISEAAKALGLPSASLRKAAPRGMDLRAEYELAEWERIARAGGLI